MTARTGMSNLLLRFRSMVFAGTADYTVNSVAYWTDDQLQDRLDASRMELHNVPLVPMPELGQQAGAAVYRYHDYAVGRGDLEEAASGTVAWVVRDANGAEVGTANYTPDYIRGIVRFTNDQMGSAYTVKARSYRLKQAAAAVWYEKAAQYPIAYDFSTEGQSFKRSQLVDQALKMAQSFDDSSGIVASGFVRTDLQ